MECDFDMTSSRMARNLSKYLFSSSDLVVDVGFVLQGNDRTELPERVLGGFRLTHVNLQAIALPCSKVD